MASIYHSPFYVFFNVNFRCINMKGESEIFYILFQILKLCSKNDDENITSSNLHCIGLWGVLIAFM